MGSPSWRGDPEFPGHLGQEAALWILGCPFPSGLAGDKDGGSSPSKEEVDWLPVCL